MQVKFIFSLLSCKKTQIKCKFYINYSTRQFKKSKRSDNQTIRRGGSNPPRFLIVPPTPIENTPRSAKSRKTSLNEGGGSAKRWKESKKGNAFRHARKRKRPSRAPPPPKVEAKSEKAFLGGKNNTNLHINKLLTNRENYCIMNLLHNYILSLPTGKAFDKKRFPPFRILWVGM